MEQFDNRDRFNKELFNKVFNELDLNRDLLAHLSSDTEKNPLINSMVVLKKLGSKDKEISTLKRMGLKDQDMVIIEEMINNLKNDVQKCFAISQYTQDRYPVKYLAGVLREHGQYPIANDLERFNQSEKDWPYGFEHSLKVKQTNNLKVENSTTHNLSGKIKGICNIFLNEMQFKNQSHLYKSIFEQMNYQVHLLEYQTCEQMKTYLIGLATNKCYERYQSLVNIFVGHGYNGLIFDAPDPPNFDSIASIRDLIDIFNDSKPGENIVNFKSKPKVYIFDCCRARTKQGEEWCLANCQDNWVNMSTLTTVVYSCAEGQLTMYLETHPSHLTGYSVYGRALCYSIAQFACDFDLDRLLKKAQRRLENDFEDLKQMWGNTIWKDEWKQLPEVKQSNTKKDIYFNPGCSAE